MLKKILRKLSALTCALVCTLVFLYGVTAKNRTSVESISHGIKTTPQKQIVVIDAGHGGFDGGCTSINGVNEKDINLSISNNLKDMLTVMGFDVKCTRTEDVSVNDKDSSGKQGTQNIRKKKISDMKNRLALFNKYKDGISLSIHQNQFTDSKYYGAQMFYSEKNPAGERLAQCMQKQFVKNLQPDNKRETKSVGDELYLLNNTSCPSVMIECGFLSNPDEAKKLESAPYQKQVSFTILTGLFEYLNENPK